MVSLFPPLCDVLKSTVAKSRMSNTVLLHLSILQNRCQYTGRYTKHCKLNHNCQNKWTKYLLWCDILAFIACFFTTFKIVISKGFPSHCCELLGFYCNFWKHSYVLLWKLSTWTYTWYSMLVQNIFTVFVSHVVTIWNEPEYLGEFSLNFAALDFFLYVYLPTKYSWFWELWVFFFFLFVCSLLACFNTITNCRENPNAPGNTFDKSNRQKSASAVGTSTHVNFQITWLVLRQAHRVTLC